MLLAHLVGDYLLQTDGIARWKSREMKGVLAHGALLTLTTILFALPFDAGWWPWALAIGLAHTAIDGATFWVSRRFPLHSRYALARLVVDQTIHLSIILAALVASGYLETGALARGIVAAVQSNRLLAIATGYVFITMPAWILIEFGVFGLLNGSAPDFSQATNKYVGMLERGLITTFVVTGQLALAPVVALPRLVLEGPQVMGSRRATVYIAELLASVTLAVVIGLALRGL
jgi:hypothetical protein